MSKPANFYLNKIKKNFNSQILKYKKITKKQNCHKSETSLCFFSLLMSGKKLSLQN